MTHRPKQSHGVLLEAVADKTGYPIDMLELDMRLDTDLGIDSIKRVEILSAVQEQLPRAGSISPEQLGSLASLRQIVEALCGRLLAQRRRHAELSKRPSRPKSVNTNGTVHSAQWHASNGDRHGDGIKGREPARPLAVRAFHPVLRGLKHADTREQVRLRAGGMVWVTSDGSPLTDAVCAALRKRETFVVR